MSTPAIGDTIETQMGPGTIIEIRTEEIEFAGPCESCISQGGIIVVELGFKLANQSKALLYLSTDERKAHADEYMQHHREVMQEIAAEAATGEKEYVSVDIKSVHIHTTDHNTGIFEMHVHKRLESSAVALTLAGSVFVSSSSSEEDESEEEDFACAFLSRFSCFASTKARQSGLCRW